MKKRRNSNIQIQLNNEEYKVWQNIVAKSLAVRCQHIVKEEKRKLLKKMARVINEELYYD